MRLASRARYASRLNTFTMKARFVDDTFQDITNEAPQDAHFLVDLLATRRIGRTLEVFVAGENFLMTSASPTASANHSAPRGRCLRAFRFVF